MPVHAQEHQQLKDLLAKQAWDEAQALWLELASNRADQPEFLLLLVKEFADAGQGAIAAELAALLVPNLKAAGKPHEWLFALKLQAATARANDKDLRAELVAAYQVAHEADPRLKVILGVAELDRPNTPFGAALARADTLLALATGSFCQHKSWGFGLVQSFDAALNRLVVSFPHNPEHAFQLAYAAESLVPIAADHIEARKATDLDGLRRLAESDPVALLRTVLHSLGQRAWPAQIEACLSGSVVPAEGWKKWWTGALRLLKRDPHFEMPVKRNDPIILRAVPVSQQDELLATFRDTPDLGRRMLLARELIGMIAEIPDPDLILREVGDGLVEAVRRTPASKVTARLEGALLLEELLGHQRTRTESGASLITEELARVTDLTAVLTDLPPAATRRAVAFIKGREPQRLLALANQLPAKALEEMADLLAASAEAIVLHVRNQTAGLELLYWLCKAFTDPQPPAWLDRVPQPELLAAVLNALDDADRRSATKKLRDLLFSEEALVSDLLAQASVETVRESTRRLLASTAFDELSRRSLTARLVKEYPYVQEMLISRTVQEAPLIVSRRSFEQRQAELDELVQKKIPQNSRDIAQARSYGDLRENFEFKAAKEAQRVLMRRRAELELLLARAVPTDFSDVKTETVQIGTSINVTELGTGQALAYHILGAWDGNPDLGIISYPAALAQVFLNKPAGEVVEWQADGAAHRFRIERIEKVPADILARL